jgi:2-polyprenyl-3-methyl-5-hydroxy-6-metoxy-1,4-benzoquinol methylase
MIACDWFRRHNRRVNSFDRQYALTHSVSANDWLFDALVERIAPQPGWRVLDVGCNTGELTARLAALQCRTLGLDINTDAIALARQRFPSLPFEAGTLNELPERDFDAIVASHIIEHLPDPASFLRAVRDHLRPSGQFVLATPNRHAWPRRCAYRLWDVAFFDDPTHVLLYSAGELSELLRQGGFVNIRTSTRRLYFPLAARLPRRLHLAVPTFGMGDHLLVSAAAPSAHT